MDTNLHVRLPKEYGQEQIDQLLVDKFTFAVEAPITKQWTFFDTFDWRLFNRSLALRYTDQQLILDHLTGGETLDGLSGISAPGFARDLPESPLRNHLTSLIKMRALLPLAEIQTWTRIYRILNRDEKTVARLVATEARMLGEGKDPVLAVYLSLRPVRGYPKYARKLTRHLGSTGTELETSLIEDLYLSALERAGNDPGSYSGKLDLRLKPKKRSDASTKVILRRLLEIMKANEAGIKADIDTEFLHDYRIAVRRTRSALSQIRNVFPTDVTDHFKKEFRTVGRRTNELRDLDVYLLSENAFKSRLPAVMREDIVPLFEYLRA